MNWLTLVPILLALGARLLPGPRIVDDAYITFRYAQNLTLGHGLVYNPGEWVIGTTTPLYTLLLAGLSRLLGSGDLVHLSWLVNACLDAGGTALVFWLGRRLTGEKLVGFGAALLWAVAPFSVTFAIGGLETSLVITLLLAAAACFLAQRDSWSAFLLALGVLARPDVLIAALLILGAVTVEWGWRQKLRLAQERAGRVESGKLTRGLASLPYRPLAAFLIPLLPWFLFATAVYGSPLPQSMAAKSAAYHLSPEAALVRLLQHFGTPYHEHLLFGGRWVMVGLVLHGSLYLMGSLDAVRRDRRAAAVLAYPWLYAAVYAAANPLLFRWYLSPPLPFLILGVVSGVRALTRALFAASDLGGRIAARPCWATKAGAQVVTLCVILLFLFGSLNAWDCQSSDDRAGSRPAPSMAWIELETLYRQVAFDLKDDLASSSGRLAAGDIGALGWYTGAPILDLVGLISPQATRYYPLPDDAYVINFAVSTDLVLAERPAFVVILEVYGRNTLLADERFLAAYRLWRAYPTDVYGSNGMLVFQQFSKELPWAPAHFHASPPVPG